MKKEKTLQEVKTEIENLEEEKENYERELQQLKNREKILIKQAKIKEQKKRNHRLIVRGVILESFIEGAEEKSNEEIKAILEKFFAKNQAEKKRASNLNFKDIETEQDDIMLNRIYSRIIEMCLPLRITGQDRRKTQSKEKKKKAQNLIDE